MTLPAALLGGALSVASCGVGPHHTLNSASVSGQIAQQISSKYGIAAPAVLCPSTIPSKADQRFVCTTALEGQALEIDGTVTGNGSKFTPTPAEAIVPVGPAVSLLRDEISKQIHQTPSVNCGPHKVLVVAVNSSFACSATFKGEKPRPVTVTVTNLDGTEFRFSLAPASGT